MRKPVSLQLRAVETSRNGRSRRLGAEGASMIGERMMRRLRGLHVFRGVGRVLGEIFGMAVVLALSIVLAHAILVVMFPV